MDNFDKFEYHLIIKDGPYRSSDMRDDLNEFGQQGWKVVSIYPDGEYLYAYLERKIKS